MPNICQYIYDTDYKLYNYNYTLTIGLSDNKPISYKTCNTVANKEILDNLIKEYENDLEKAAKFIMENLINNCKFYVKLKKSKTDKHTAFTYNISLNTDEIININFLDELSSTTNSNELLLFYLNDLLNKLKLNVEINITKIYLDDDYNIKDIYSELNNNNAKQIKIGYINEEAKMYNKDLIVYGGNVDLLVEILKICIVSQFDRENVEINKDIINKLNIIFRN